MIVSMHAVEVGTEGRRNLGRSWARWIWHLAVDLEERGQALWIASSDAEGDVTVGVQWGAPPDAGERREVSERCYAWLHGVTPPTDPELAKWAGL